MFGGFIKKEYEEATGEAYYMETTYPGVKELQEAEFYINFLIYVLPFALVFDSVKHMNKSFKSDVESLNTLIVENKSSMCCSQS